MQNHMRDVTSRTMKKKRTSYMLIGHFTGPYLQFESSVQKEWDAKVHWNDLSRHDVDYINSGTCDAWSSAP